MSRIWPSLPVIVVLCLGAFVFVGAGSRQAERPPQPFFQDFISGVVTVQGEPAPAGTQLIACIDDCETVFESEPKTIGEGGTFELLEVNPSDENLIGNEILFFLVNEFGEIKAAETRYFVGVFDFYPVDLTFNDPLPTPSPTPSPSPTPTPSPTPPPTLTPPTAVPPTSTPTLIPTATATLPVTGDPTVTEIPRLALLVGGTAFVVGAALLLAVRRGNKG